MIINTKSILVKSKFTRKLCIKEENEDIFDILNSRNKILHLLKENPRTTKDLSKDLSLEIRGVRKHLNLLEKIGLITRKTGKLINKKFRYSDTWVLTKDINILTKVPKNHVCMYYKTEHGGKSYKNHFLILPDTINVSDELIFSIGFFIAEGSKTKIKTIEITNNEPNLISLFIKTISSFYVDSTDWRWRIAFNKKLKNVFSSEELNHLENLSIKFWIYECNLSKNNFVSFNYSGQENGKLRKNTSIWGTLILNYNNFLLTWFLFQLFRFIKKLIFTEKEFIIDYLKGYLSGEAYVGSHNREIQFASTCPEDLKFAQICLNQLGIKTSLCKATVTSPPKVIITNLKNFLILYEFDIFEYHFYKKRELLQKILNYQIFDQNIKNEVKREFEFINSMILSRKTNFRKFISKIPA